MPSKQRTNEMDDREFLAYLRRSSLKEDAAYASLGIGSAALISYFAGFPVIAAGLCMAVAGAVTLVVRYLHATEPQFVSTVPAPDPDFDPVAEWPAYEIACRERGDSEEEIAASRAFVARLAAMHESRSAQPKMKE